MTTAQGACRLILLLALCFPATANAQVLDVFDPGSFNGGYVAAVAVQPNGKILVGGDFTTIGTPPATQTRVRIARLNSDGTLDMAFLGSANGLVNSIVVQRDGKIVIAGEFTALGGETGADIVRHRLGRLNADGSVDTSFNPGANGTVRSLLLEPDGQIVAGGLFSGLGGGSGATARKYIGRLNEDGTVDAGFNPGADNPVYTMALQPDGAIVVGGAFSGLGQIIGSTPRAFIGRVAADGTLDMGFDPGANAAVFALAVQADGAILVGGNFTGLGNGTGTTPRSFLGRLTSGGAVDPSFAPSIASSPNPMGVVRAVGLRADGKIVVGGSFFTLTGGIAQLNDDGTPDPTFALNSFGSRVEAIAFQVDGRLLLAGPMQLIVDGVFVFRDVARLIPTVPAQSVLAAAGGTMTWQVSGSLPEASWVEFASSVDGISFTEHGRGTRVAGGWERTGVTLPSDPNLRIRARAFTATGYQNGSGSIIESSWPLPGANMIKNGTFDTDGAGWLQFAIPETGGMTSNVTGGVFQFFRTGTQAVVFQQTHLPLPARASVEISFDAGNTDVVRKRLTALIHDADFTDLAVCTFWLPAGTPVQRFTMRAFSSQAWHNATLSFYAATPSSGGFYQIDNVAMSYQPTGTTTDTICVDPLVSPPSGGAAGPNLLVNGTFPTTNLPPWSLYGLIDGAVSAGVFEFTRFPGTPTGVLLQPTGQAMASGEILEATFQLGSSGGRARVTVLLHDSDFTDLAACTFWLSPGQALSTYRMRMFASEAWTDATVSVYPATPLPQRAMRLDNVAFRRIPGQAIAGTECAAVAP